MKKNFFILILLYFLVIIKNHIIKDLDIYNIKSLLAKIFLFNLKHKTLD